MMLYGLFWFYKVKVYEEEDENILTGAVPCRPE